MTLPSTLECTNCHRRFGGVETYDRHLVRRQDRCKTIPELKKAHMRKDALGVWRRQLMKRQTTLVDKRRLSPGRSGPQLGSQGKDTGPPLSVDSVGTPTDKNAGA